MTRPPGPLGNVPIARGFPVGNPCGAPRAPPHRPGIREMSQLPGVSPWGTWAARLARRRAGLGSGKCSNCPGFPVGNRQRQVRPRLSGGRGLEPRVFIAEAVFFGGCSDPWTPELYFTPIPAPTWIAPENPRSFSKPIASSRLPTGEFLLLISRIFLVDG